VTGGVLGDLFWSAGDQDLATLVTALRAEINNPVATTDHVQIVLDRGETPLYDLKIRGGEI
jgi:hypothetical protein